jgi:hypothetical protein
MKRAASGQLTPVASIARSKSASMLMSLAFDRPAVFRRLTLRDRIAEFFLPRLRREREKQLREGIRWLMDNPDVPVVWDE